MLGQLFIGLPDGGARPVEALRPAPASGVGGVRLNAQGPDACVPPAPSPGRPSVSMSDSLLSSISRVACANYDRLIAFKAKYDPTNLFRLNQNVTATV